MDEPARDLYDRAYLVCAFWSEDFVVYQSIIELPENALAMLAAGAPVITRTYIWLLVLRILHILSAAILVGGIFYIRYILAPSGVQACFADRRALWARWVAIASTFLLVSGIYNYLNYINLAKAAGEKLDPTYHMLMGVKMLLALVVMFIAAVIAGKSSLAERFRTNIEGWLKVAWLASLTIIVLGAILRTFHQ